LPFQVSSFYKQASQAFHFQISKFSIPEKITVSAYVTDMSHSSKPGTFNDNIFWICCKYYGSTSFPGPFAAFF